MALSHSPSLVMNGLVLCLDAGNSKSYPGSGTTWTDLSGTSNGTFGSSTQAPTYNSANGGSIVFGGVNDYAIVNDAASIRFGTGDYTLEVFVYATDITGGSNGRIMASKGFGGLEFVFYVGSLYITPPVITAGSGWAANTWYHLVSSRLSGVQTSYKNAVSIRTTTTAVDISFSGVPFVIGARSSLAEGFFQGRIPVVRLYNRGLTQAEVSQNYNALKGRFSI